MATIEQSGGEQLVPVSTWTEHDIIAYAVVNGLRNKEELFHEWLIDMNQLIVDVQTHVNNNQ